MLDNNESRDKSDIKWDNIVEAYYKMSAMVETINRENAEYLNLMRVISIEEESLASKRKTINRCTKLYKQIKDKLDKKKEKSLEEFNNVIRETARIVPDSKLSDIELKIKDNRAAVTTPDGQGVNPREGGAVRSILGTLMSANATMAIPDAIPIMIFDESFFSLSENTAVEMRDNLAELSKKLLIIGIEQKATVFQGIDGLIVYEFIKGSDEITRIRKVE